MEQKNLILTLITDDLLNQKLISNFRDIGIDAENYNLALGNTIFRLMGIDRPVHDRNFDQYIEFAEQAKYFLIEEGRAQFHNYAQEIYTYLESLKSQPIYYLNTMNQQISKNQVIRLITMDLINVKLTTHLSEIPLVPDHYMLGIDEIVFEVMGIEALSDACVDQIYQNYVARARKVITLQVSYNRNEIDKLAEELYEYLAHEVNVVSAI